MTPIQEQKMIRLIEALEEMNLMLKRAILTCEALEKELRVTLNEDRPQV